MIEVSLMNLFSDGSHSFLFRQQDKHLGNYLSAFSHSNVSGALGSIDEGF